MFRKSGNAPVPLTLFARLGLGDVASHLHQLAVIDAINVG